MHMGTRTSKYTYTLLLSLDLAAAPTTLVKYVGTALPTTYWRLREREEMEAAILRVLYHDILYTNILYT